MSCGTEHKSWEGGTQERSWDANVKRTYDEYQDVALSAARRSQEHYDQLVQQQQTRFAELNQLSTQAIQNAVETANMVAKQAVRHGDLSIDKQWNLEPSEAAAQAQVLPSLFLDAIKAAVVAAIAEALTANKKQE